MGDLDDLGWAEEGSDFLDALHQSMTMQRKIERWMQRVAGSLGG